MKKICIVTTRHISYNPRVVKEADILCASGYAVTVVTVNNHEAQSRFDAQLMKTRTWKLRTVNFRKTAAGEKRTWFFLSIKQKAFSLLSKLTPAYGIAERRLEKAFDGLLQLAKEEKADLYLTHHAEALGIGFRAARTNTAKFGFDAEDFHTGMDDPASAPLIAYLEKKYLPHCDYLTAASKGIGEAYATKYAIRSPITILNVFPGVDLDARQAGQPVRFYWYSQVIGPGRSLEMLIAAAGQLGGAFEIHIRGSFYSDAYKHELHRLMGKAGIQDKVFFHPPILPEEIIPEANRYDIGLALESPATRNRDICVTNKVFSYLMSGLALVLTDTYGQRDIFTGFPDAGRLCRADDKDDLAAAMRFFLHRPEQLYLAKTAARKAAEGTFNWENESKKLLAAVNTCLS